MHLYPLCTIVMAC